MSRSLFRAQNLPTLLFIAGGLCLIPTIDILSFHFFNGHLKWMPTVYHAAFAVMNHRLESLLNVVVIFSSMMIGIPIKKSLFHHLKIILMLVLWYELFFQTVNYAEKNIFLARPSPSLLLNLHVNLSDFAPHSLIKVYATSSFPSGHAMVLGYWYQIARKLFASPWRHIGMSLSLLMCLPRLVAGAHWLSDVLFGFALGCLAFFLIEKFLPKEESNKV